MVDSAVLDEILDALAGVRHSRDTAIGLVASKPGLYAFFGDGDAWSDLGLAPAYPDQPLYVGKAERSLNGRDVRTHFSSGKTGSSTLRRSLAALLSANICLVAVPRNLPKPDRFANFGLSAVSDARLSEWMEQRLTLATWPRSATDQSLDEFETAVVVRLRPPLNLQKVGEPRESLRAARRRMADAARTWRSDVEE